MNDLEQTNMLQPLVDEIETAVSNAKKEIAEKVNSVITETYWKIGKYIVEFEQDGNGKAAYGSNLLTYDKPEDVIKDTYTLEFLGLPEKERYSEEDLEQKIIDNLQTFLLELGKGFTVVGRQYPLTVNNIHYHVDLVFYHRILKCFVLIDLKKNSVQHIDIGQMNMYMGYFAKEENMADDNPPIGIILSHNKDELLVEYATYGMDSNLFVSKYEFYLQNRN